jgi:Cupredoxin-like domain
MDLKYDLICPKKIMNKVRYIISMLVATVLISSLLYGIGQNGYHLHLVSAAKGKDANSATNRIQLLSVKEVKDGVYNWINMSNGASNPTLDFLVNTKNVIKIQNPTDTKHELIIDTGADALPSSDDIVPNGSGRLVFSPNMTGTFTYHCAYHPFTMKGTIHVAG